MRETQPGDTLEYMQKWLQFQEMINGYLPIIPVYSNVYFDFSKNANTQASAAERRAVCSDAFNNNYDITIKELREGIEKSGVHLKLFNFDDCLMNCTEVAAEFTDVSDYMLAANHVTTGGNYDQFIGHLAKAGITGDFEGEMKKYVDKFIAGYNDLSAEEEVLKKYPNAKQHCAYAFTDLKKFKGVIPALKAFVDKLLSEAKSGKLTADQQKFAADKTAKKYSPASEVHLHQSQHQSQTQSFGHFRKYNDKPLQHTNRFQSQKRSSPCRF